MTIAQGRRAEAAALYAQYQSSIRVERMTGISRDSVIRFARERGVPIAVPGVYVPDVRWDIDAHIARIDAQSTADLARGGSAFSGSPESNQ